MEEWKEYKLRELTVMKNGKKRPIGNGSFPVYGGNGIMDYTDDFNSERTIIVGRVGAYCGCVYKCDNKCWVSDNAIAVYTRDLVDFYFLYYLMTTLDFHHHHIGGAQPLMTQDIIGDVIVKVPSIQTQKEVVSILKSLDDKIDCNRRINDNLEQQAQVLFKSWFVDFEPFKNGEFVESEIGMIPKGWRVVSLNDACIKITDGSHYSPKDNPLGTIPMLSVKDMLHNGFDYSSCKMIDEDEYEKMRANDCVPLKNDILVAKDGSYLKEIFICSESAKQAILSSIAMFRCNKNVIFPEILLQLLRLPKVRKDVGDNYVSGSALPRIVLKDFKKFRFVIAPIDIQNEIAGTLQSINMQIYKNEQESRRLAQLRDTLLPRLMSGKLKVNEIEKV